MIENADTVFVTETGNKISVKKVERLGHGGFGIVYSATLYVIYPLKRKIVEKWAVKYCKKETSLDKIQALKHPNLVPILFCGQIVEGKSIECQIYNYCIAMEYCPDGTLHIKATKTKLSIPVIKNYTRQLLRGLDYLHNHGIIHTDLKGENILMTNNCSVIKIADFDGHVALKELSTKSTDLEKCKGTWQWMSPEMVLLQFRKHPESKELERNVGRKTDIWSLGCVVLEMLTRGHLQIMSADRKTITSPFQLNFAATKGGFYPNIPVDTPSNIIKFLKWCLKKESDLRPFAGELLYGPNNLFDEENNVLKDHSFPENSLYEIEMPALGRNFFLGSLYNICTDEISPGVHQHDTPYKSISTPLNCSKYHRDIIINEDTIRNKFAHCRMSYELQLSFISGLLDVSGAAKYLFDQKRNSTHARIIIACSLKIRHERLSLKHLCKSKKSFLSLVDAERYTHIVAGITYGTECYVVCEVPSSLREEIAAALKEAIATSASIDTTAFLDKIKASVRKLSGAVSTEQIRWMFYVDGHLLKSESFVNDITDNSPKRTFSYRKEQPEGTRIVSDYCVPVTVWLCPLSAIDSKAETIFRPIEASLIKEIVTIFEEMMEDHLRIIGLLDTPVNNIFPFIKRQIVEVMKLLERYWKNTLKSRLREVVPLVREGTLEPNELIETVNSHRRSSFDRSSLNKWCASKDKIQTFLQEFVTQIKGSNFISFSMNKQTDFAASDSITTCVLQFLANEKQRPLIRNTTATYDINNSLPFWGADMTMLANADYLIKIFWDLAKKRTKEGFRLLVDPNAKQEINDTLTVSGTDPVVRIVLSKGQSEMWIQNPEFMRLDTQSPVGATFGANIIVAGGYDVGDSFRSTVELFCPDLNKWTAFPSLPIGRYGAGAAFLNGKIYVLGGTQRAIGVPTSLMFAEGGTKWIEMEYKLNLKGETTVVAAFGSLYMFTVHEKHSPLFGRLDPRENSWIRLASPIYKPYYHPSTAKLGNYIYACGGLNYENTDSSIVERYEIRMDRWETVQAMQQGSSYFRAASDDNYLYAIGGLEIISRRQCIKTTESRPLRSTSLWKRMTGGRPYFRATSDDNYLNATGEFTSNQSNCQRFDPFLNTWESLPQADWGRWGHCIAIAGNDLYAIGGVHNETVEMFKPVTKEWSFCSPMSVERDLACAVVVPSDFYTPPQ